MSARQIRRDRERQAERERNRRIGKAALAIGTALGATVLFAPAAHADTFEVTSLDDDNDPGTLRYEIETNANGNGEDDVIVFQAGLTGTIELDVGNDINIVGEGLEVQGPGADVITVDANGTGDPYERVFDLYGFDDPDEQVSISGLTLTGGDISEAGGAIHSDDDGGEAAELTIADSVITGNYAYNDGGGVYVDGGSLTITNSLMSNNSAGEDGGGVIVQNTDGDQPTEVVIRDSVLTGNDAGEDGSDGGGISLSPNGATVIERSSVSGNTATDNGGGIYINSGTVADVTIRGTTVSGNSASDHPSNPLYSDGGGIGIDDLDYSVTIENATVSGNSTSGSGAGVYADSGAGDDGELTIRNSTIASNAASDAGGGVYRDGYYAGPGLTDSADFPLSSTIVASNSAPDGPDLGEDPEINTGDGAFLVGFSLVENTADATIEEVPSGSNITGLDPQLGPLAANGGPTQTHAPSLSSPVLDHGINNNLQTDQRGLARTSDLALVPNGPSPDGSDIGSVEIQASDVEAACQGATVRKLSGTDGADTLTGTDAAEALFGLAGNDTLDGAGGNDCVSGGDGADGARGGAGKDQVSGDAGKDNAKGGGGKDTVRGGKGADRAAGGGGKDKVKGNAGKDTLKGGGKKDTLNGAKGKDTLKGGGGNDKLKGGPGKDKLKGGGGKDRFNCGGGSDKVTAQPKDKVSANCEKVVEPG